MKILDKSMVWARGVRSLLCLLLVIFAISCKQTNLSDEVISITIKGDSNCIINKLNIVKIQKGFAWKDIKKIAEATITVKENKEIKEWRLNDAKGEVIKDSKIFEKDETVWSVSKVINTTYLVEHWQENIIDENYTKLETETERGEAGRDSEAVAKEYKGFTAQAITQEKVKADGSTVIKVLYKRNIISLILDLQGGKTTTELKNEDGKNVLEGKFGASVNVENPTKENFAFGGFTPELPKTFLLDEDKKEYVAQWGKVVRINIIEGDERLEVKEREVSFPIEKVRTFGDVRASLEEKISLKPAWTSGDYGIYDFRRENYEGEEIKDDSPVEDGMKVYPRSNYINFNWGGEHKTVILGCNGERPRGKIIIPTKTIRLNYTPFTDELAGDNKRGFIYSCELVSVDFTGCKNLETVDALAFNWCPKLESLNFTGCSKLKEFRFYGDNHTGLKSLNLKGCTELTKVKCSLRMSFESLDLSLCAKLEELSFSKGYWGDGTINLTGCNNLIYINIEDSGIRSIDLSPCPKLDTVVFRNCRNINSVNLTGCTELTNIDICSGSSITSIDLSPYKKLKKVHFCENSSLKNVDLSGCTALEKIDERCINYCKNAEVKLGKNIKVIERKAFDCKKVLVPNETIKQLVKASGYPEDRIEMYN